MRAWTQYAADLDPKPSMKRTRGAISCTLVVVIITIHALDIFASSDLQMTIVQSTADNCFDVTVVLPDRLSAAQFPEPSDMIRGRSD